MSSIQLTFGAGSIDRVVDNAGEFLAGYREDIGYTYLRYRPNTPPDRIVPEDLGVTLLVNSQASGRAFQSLMENASYFDLTRLPDKPLEATSADERKQIAGFIAEMAAIPGFAASLATKLLHKKRPGLIPILDNQAIFGAYMNKAWPQKIASTESIKRSDHILQALNWITYDLTRAENEAGWRKLQTFEPWETRIELFDSVWWMYFRIIQPIKRAGE